MRDIADFPRPGILFKDITPLLSNAELFARTTDAMAAPFSSDLITHVVAVESRGFILGGPVAQRLGAGFVPVRKPGKLPSGRRSVTYALEYGTDVLEVHSDALVSGDRVLVVDDVLATGGTANATCELVEGAGATVVGCTFLAVLTTLPGVARLASRRFHRLVAY
ncbi:MAG: adenine phosphoribosyltransferase [Gemmatimonadaceae bacterium]